MKKSVIGFLKETIKFLIFVVSQCLFSIIIIQAILFYLSQEYRHDFDKNIWFSSIVAYYYLYLEHLQLILLASLFLRIIPLPIKFYIRSFFAGSVICYFSLALTFTAFGNDVTDFHDSFLSSYDLIKTWGTTWAVLFMISWMILAKILLEKKKT